MIFLIVMEGTGRAENKLKFIRKRSNNTSANQEKKTADAGVGSEGGDKNTKLMSQHLSQDIAK